MPNGHDRVYKRWLGTWIERLNGPPMPKPKRGQSPEDAASFYYDDLALKIADVAYRDPWDYTALDGLVEATKPGKHPAGRYAALYGITEVGPRASSAAKQLLPLLQDDDPGIRMGVIHAFWNMAISPGVSIGRGSVVVKPLIEVMEDERQEVDLRAAAAGALEALTGETRFSDYRTQVLGQRAQRVPSPHLGQASRYQTHWFVGSTEWLTDGGEDD